MTRLDAVRIIGDVLTEIDVARSSEPGANVKQQLDDIRDRLNCQQLKILNMSFDENSQEFQDVLENLETTKPEIIRTVQRPEENLANLLRNFDRFLNHTATLLACGLPGNPITHDPGKKPKK